MREAVEEQADRSGPLRAVALELLLNSHIARSNSKAGLQAAYAQVNRYFLHARAGDRAAAKQALSTLLRTTRQSKVERPAARTWPGGCFSDKRTEPRKQSRSASTRPLIRLPMQLPISSRRRAIRIRFSSRPRSSTSCRNGGACGSRCTTRWGGGSRCWRRANARPGRTACASARRRTCRRVRTSTVLKPGARRTPAP